MIFGPEFILYVAPGGAVKCAACETARALVAKLGLDCEIRPGEFAPGAVCADRRLHHALHSYWFVNDRFPDGAPVLVNRLLRQVELDAADFAEMEART